MDGATANDRQDGQGTLKVCSLVEFISHFTNRLKGEGQKAALFLGAGASASSGIPTAGALVAKEWLPRDWQNKTGERREPEEEELSDWARETRTILNFMPLLYVQSCLRLARGSSSSILSQFNTLGREMLCLNVSPLRS